MLSMVVAAFMRMQLVVDILRLLCGRGDAQTCRGCGVCYSMDWLRLYVASGVACAELSCSLVGDRRPHG